MLKCRGIVYSGNYTNKKKEHKISIINRDKELDTRLEIPEGYCYFGIRGIVEMHTNPKNLDNGIEMAKFVKAGKYSLQQEKPQSAPRWNRGVSWVGGVGHRGKTPNMSKYGSHCIMGEDRRQVGSGKVSLDHLPSGGGGTHLEKAILESSGVSTAKFGSKAPAAGLEFTKGTLLGDWQNAVEPPSWEEQVFGWNHDSGESLLTHESAFRVPSMQVGGLAGGKVHKKKC